MTIWQMTIDNVWVNPLRMNAQLDLVRCRVTLSPAEMLLMRAGLLRAEDLAGAYREAIEHGHCELYEIVA